MDDHPVDELRMLRERAYGPDADISLDPAALARLNELEGRAAAVPVDESALGPGPGLAGQESPATQPSTEEFSAEPELTDDPPAGAETASPAEGADLPAPDPEVAPVAASPFRAFLRSRMGRITVAALALFLAAVVGAALTMATVDRHDRVAVLDADPEAEWPEGFFGPERGGAVIYDELLGVTPIYVPDDWTDVEGTFCLYMTRTDRLQGTEGPGILTAGCTAGDFDATTALLVNADMPAELLERFPEGTALQFVVDGSTVSVYADTP
ncbi:hypothetical protein ASD56_04240 [Microbacterium sp. Root166]|uniref:hypothetical protein n=1 Tax=Microbacterium sp. Root166 TaxID=1736478 RepID=UPI0006FC005C|nr:hypothetical protein [Microbacterium sp. Root166]KQZ85536.1 hypothetical protein ASD56_04240 [Microbacterium sp. Root166]